MSVYSDQHVLTPERLADLRLLAAGARRKGTAPWECSKARLAWFEREGYVTLGAHPPRPIGRRPERGEPMRRWGRRQVTVTAKGLEAIKQADASVLSEAS